MKSNFSSVFLGFFQTFKTSSKSTYVTSIPIQASLLDLIGCSCGKGENTMTVKTSSGEGHNDYLTSE